MLRAALRRVFPRFGRAAEESSSTNAFREVRLLEIRTRGLVDSLFSGEYSSVFHGRGLEFSHVRRYQVGDDVRAIDWKVTARRGTPFVRQFVEDRDLLVVLLVDVSGSGRFGPGEQSAGEVAAELSAAIAFAAARNNDRIGLVLVSDRVEHYPAQLSGGEQQRVALARAFANQPKVLFVDEPTGNLDAETGRRIIDLLVELNAAAHTTLIMVTHDLELAARAHRIIRLNGGRITSDAA